MPEGKFCNKKPVETEEELKALLGDTGGKQYYEEMKSLEVDQGLLWKTIQNTTSVGITNRLYHHTNNYIIRHKPTGIHKALGLFAQLGSGDHVYDLYCGCGTISLFAADLAERVTGVELVDELCALAAREGFGVYFLGARLPIVEAVAQRLTERHPGLDACGPCGHDPSNELDTKENGDENETMHDDGSLVGCGRFR